MGKTRGKFSGSAGTTLVEMLATLALIGILMVMVIGVMSPAAKVFVRMQRLQYAQLILDNIEDEIKGQLLEAAEYVKIYDTEAIAGVEGKDSGSVLEYIHTSGYVTVMSAGGCEETQIWRGGEATGTEDEVPRGRMLMRYYLMETGSSVSRYKYTVSSEGIPIARAVHMSFTDKYYMGNYLKLTFSFPEEAADGKNVPYLNITAELYQDEDCTDLFAAEDFTAELRYKAVRTNSQTAE